MKFNMVKKLSVAALLVAICALSSAANAQLVSDSISYGVGDITTTSSGTWVLHSGAGTDPQVLATPSDSGNSLSFTGLAPSAGNRVQLTAANANDVHRAFAPVIGDGNSVYYSALVKVTTQPTAGGAYFLHFAETGSTTLFNGRLFVQSSGAGFVFALRGSSTGTLVVDSTVRNLNTTYFVVVRMRMIAGADNDEAALWVDPTPGGAEGAPTLIAVVAAAEDVTAAGIGRICLRQAAGEGVIELDEFRVGTTYADVTPTSGGGGDDPELQGPGSVVFPGTEVLFTSQRTLTVTNAVTSTVNLNITGFTFGSGDAGFFSVISGVPQSGIAPGASHDIVLEFAPGATPGVRNATFNLASNDSGDPTIPVTLSGEGIAYTDVANIAAARALPDATYVRITGPVTMTTNPSSFGFFGGQRAWPCEDATGGILVAENDTNRVLAAVSGPGTVITGMRGQIDVFFDQIELLLHGVGTETTGTPLTPQVTTAALLFGPPIDTFESELVQINSISLQSDPNSNGVWTASTNYPFTDVSGSLTVRFTGGAQSSLIGTPLPALLTPVTLVGIGTEFAAAGQLSPASLADLSQVDAAHDWSLFE